MSFSTNKRLINLEEASGTESKFRPRTGHEGPEGEQRYCSTLSLTSALDGVGGQRHAPGALPPGKTRYPLHRKLGGLQGRSGRLQKISPPPRFDPRTVQAVARSYVDWAIPAHNRRVEGTLKQLGSSLAPTVTFRISNLSVSVKLS
jgi:hypothetical protein